MRNVGAFLLVLAVVLVGVIGYIAYLLYPRFDLPVVDAVGLLLLAVGAGAASFFSPCSFPLLATLLTREATGPALRRKAVLGRALTYAAALSLGATVFLMLSGFVIALGGEALFKSVTFTSASGRIIRAIVGTVLVLLGLIQTRVLKVPFHHLSAIVRPLMTRQASLRRENPIVGFALFGFGYLLAGFGWTGPILAGLAGHTFAMAGFAGAFTAFAMAAATIIALMFTLSLLVAAAQEVVATLIDRGAVLVRTWTGVILVAIGAWLVVLAVLADVFARFFPV